LHRASCLGAPNAGDNGVTGSGSTRLTQQSQQELREVISRLLARDIIDLVEG
jgi:hypothetical protein